VTSTQRSSNLRAGASTATTTSAMATPRTTSEPWVDMAGVLRWTNRYRLEGSSEEVEVVGWFKATEPYEVTDFEYEETKPPAE